MGASSFIQLASLRGLDVPSSVPIAQMQKQKLRVKYSFEVTCSVSGRGRGCLPRSAGRIENRGLIIILVNWTPAFIHVAPAHPPLYLVFVSPCAQSQPTVCDPVDGSPPGSSVNGIF